MLRFISSEFWIVSGGLLFFGTAILLLTNRPRWNEYAAFGLIVGTYIPAWTFLHPRQTILTEGAKQVQAMIGEGTPVRLEFQSPC